MELNIYFILEWVDNRVQLNSTPGIEENVEFDFISSLWMPDIYLYNLKDMSTKNQVFPERGLAFHLSDQNQVEF